MANVAFLDVIADVAQIVRGAPNGTLIAAYARAARKFCRESRWYRTTIEGETTAGTRLYTLGSDPYLEVLGLRAASAKVPAEGTPWPLRIGDTTNWSPNESQGRPMQYAYMPEAQVAVHPLPDAVYGLTLTLVLEPKAGANALPEELLVKWDQALQAGALGYLLALPGMPWTDPTQALIQQRAFQAGINNARADEQREFNTGPTFIRRRPFIVGRM